jgi:hypothetical protein
MSLVEQKPGSEKEARDEQHGDWPQELRLHVWIVREDGRYAALSEDFNVVGMGASPEAAAKEMFELLDDYLSECASEDLPWHEVRRPIPITERLRLHAKRIESTMKRLRDIRLDSIPSRLDEDGLHST